MKDYENREPSTGHLAATAHPAEDRSTPRDRDQPVRPARWLITALAGLLILITSYLFAVRTTTGQALDNAALSGAAQEEAVLIREATGDLDQITVYSLAVAVLLVGLIGLLRRRPDLALAAVGVIVAGQIITQSLKRFVLPRPDLVPMVGHFAANSFPSGHTTIAMTVLFALLIVTSYKWRGLAMVLTLTWAVAIGADTLTARWHRLSDTIGADAVALMCACAASWWLARRGAIIRQTGRRRVLRVVFVSFVALLGVLAAVLGGGVGVYALRNWGDPQRFDTGQLDMVYDGAVLVASACSIITALLFWASWRRLDIAPRTRGSRATVGVPEVV
ncbi:hypothetical protein GCM10010174_78990 [Kutzneria viridogrisea]|uniref:Phosphatidic acid phosphatase type 2/haloperoxidase domain-containing protein n=2 Tax=Kutzneria TaxID=43356 RepID=W5WD86_9PSEU|nr:phosphatase PAP2 family protein [Kutzneria albida]AHH98710.1 hypothetical protein KALB_5348 [Kutzneria albida DSM 43870]MBA8923777.1 membrane-associated phospholipid phosphatase [Kutzneria viridogrisea]